MRGTQLHRTLVMDERSHDLAEVSAVWTRRPGRPTAQVSLGEAVVRDVVAQEGDLLVHGVWETLEVLHVPAPAAVVRRAGLKLRQLQLAARMGFAVPDTAIGNDPADLRSLYERHPMIVTKRVGSGPLGSTPDGHATAGRPTRPVRRRDLLHADDVRLCPVVVQEYIPKSLELRITVVGEDVFAVAIDSQRSARTRHDWRHYDQRTTAMWAFDLPHAVAERCRRLVGQLGLSYGAIDLILTPAGQYVFLELNPNGQYLWTEHATGLPVSQTLATMLTRASRRPVATQPRRASA
jgi:glutathione synthase/RimK-type ligase-like ATP-grasp enzyme